MNGSLPNPLLEGSHLPRPEIDCCRVCGFDIRDRKEEYLICPECGAPNNRNTARKMSEQERTASYGGLAGRYWVLALVVGAVAMYPGLVLASMFAHWLHLPWNWFARVGAAATFVVAPAIFAVATIRTPPAYRWWLRTAAASLGFAFGIALLTTLLLMIVDIALH